MQGAEKCTPFPKYQPSWCPTFFHLPHTGVCLNNESVLNDFVECEPQHSQFLTQTTQILAFKRPIINV